MPDQLQTISASAVGARVLPSRLLRQGRTSTRRQVDAATTQAWCVEYATTRSTRLREQIVADHQWLAWLCARQMHRHREPLDDLVQVANIGLLKAIDRFDPSFGVQFHTYASATMLGELRRHYRGVWRLRMPRSLQERHFAVHAALEELLARNGRWPSTADIAAHLSLTSAQVSEALGVGAAIWTDELPEDDGPQPMAGDVDGAQLVGNDLWCDELLGVLAPQARQMLIWWVVDGFTQTEIGRRLGLSQVQVSRILRRSLRTVRATLVRQSAVA